MRPACGRSCRHFNSRSDGTRWGWRWAGARSRITLPFRRRARSDAPRALHADSELGRVEFNRGWLAITTHMTKRRRVILLVVDIVTILAGIVSLILVVVLSRDPDWPRIPSRDEILAAPPATLRTKLLGAAETMEVLASMKQDARAYFMMFGSVMVAGTALRFSFTPWRIAERTDRAA